MSVAIHIGDVRQELQHLPDASVDCVVTSPPYWNLRDYQMDGQIGLEPTMEGYIETIVAVCAEVHRVLKPQGTLWLNCGDTYAGGRAGGGGKNKNSRVGAATIPAGLKVKDLCMIPNRLAIALQAWGWYVRSEIIWAKPNPMPESVTDRPAVCHEKIWLCSKSARYYYNADAVRVPLAPSSVGRMQQDIENQAGSARAHAGAKTNGTIKPRKIDGTGTDKQRGHGRRHDGFNDRWDKMSKAEQQAYGRNLRNVWTVSTKPFTGAHFATFPADLIEPCIKAGCPPGGTVLDPFGGSGTTGLVAARLQRNAILIELNPEYAAMARARIDADSGALLKAMEGAE